MGEWRVYDVQCAANEVQFFSVTQYREEEAFSELVYEIGTLKTDITQPFFFYFFSLCLTSELCSTGIVTDRTTNSQTP